ncbi:hypothetical protein [Paenibacillus chitinolyticus]
MALKDKYCPYCGDELANDEKLEALECYFNEHEACPHWEAQENTEW